MKYPATQFQAGFMPRIPSKKISVRTRRSARRNVTTRHLHRLHANDIDPIPAAAIDAGENYYA
ncbi:hypothetical protein [Burkholderia lata]|uniref:hypothetical protein n=1 Tax=Burkholderia lata (strain ATCC 17760 / DSM 23089 / LMG 22485 / NCIMB 9086 / R18194 / 383) TaxID=482957 RepID=UPI001583D2FD|nr:hypothetical protein [Burkholderia lata]